MLTIIDTLCHEYGWTINAALCCSMARAFALYAAISARYGHEPAGPSFEEQEMIAELEAKMARGARGGQKEAIWAR